DRFSRGGHVQVGGDERVRIHVLDQTVQRQGELVFRDGAPAAGPRIGGDVGGADLDPPHHTHRAGWPPSRGVVADGDLGTLHPLRVAPRRVRDRGGGPPDRRVASHPQRKVTAVVHGSGRDVPGEVAHITTHLRP